jgi:hypothetical protein
MEATVALPPPQTRFYYSGNSQPVKAGMRAVSSVFRALMLIKKYVEMQGKEDTGQAELVL